MGELAPDAEPDGSEIAIIGMAGRFPGAKDIDTFWSHLRDGVESITFLTDDQLERSGVDSAVLGDPNYVKAAALLDDVDLFDAAFFGFTPKEAETMDPQQRIFLECAWEALERAGYASEAYPGRVGVYAGARTNTYLFNLFSNPDIVASLGSFQIGLGNDLAFLSTHASHKLGLRGPSYAVHTACSTSLVAVHLACQSLLIEECDLALAGGVAVNVPQRTGYLYQVGGIASPDGRCRAFDASAQGTIFGSGAGVVALKRLADALAEGDTICAVIKGSATNNDGSLKASFTAPSVHGQTEVILDALANAGVEAGTIDYVEAHGTGTALGDPIEVRALTRAFRSSAGARGWCALGSVKTNIGHLDAAAGVASLIKTVLALQHRQIPPSLHYERPNPQIDFTSTPFYVNSRLSEWPARAHPRRAGVSAFGVGGTNAHVVLEEAPPPSAPVAPRRPVQLLTLSARTATALDAATANLAAFLRENPSCDLADAAYTLQVGRRAFAHRRALVARDRDEAIAALADLPPQQVWTSYQDPLPRPVAFLFPGGGAQYVNMGRELYESEPVFRAAFDRCADLLAAQLGRDLRDATYPPDEGRTKDEGSASGDTSLSSGRPLGIERPSSKNVGASGEAGRRNDTAERSSFVVRPSSKNAGGDAVVPPSPKTDLKGTALGLPALFAVEYALAQLWMAWGADPQALIGHSLGEYVAACLAGVLTLEDALALVALRGRLMETLPSGSMLGVPLPEAEVRDLIAEDARLALAAINGPSQCAVAGPSEAIEALAARLSAREVEFRRIAIDVAAHSPLVDPILEEFGAFVERLELRAPRLPYISNVTGTWMTDADATDPRYWVRHLRQTVQFESGVRELLGDSSRILLEVGPGNGLSTLARLQAGRESAAVALASMRHPYEQIGDSAVLQASVGKLWLAGGQIDWERMHEHAPRRRIPLPTYPFERQRFWVAAGDDAQAARRARGSGKRADLAEWFYLPAWQRALPPRPADAADQRAWLVFVDAAGVGAALVERLRRDGRRVATARVGAQFAQMGAADYTLDPRSPADYGALVQALRSDGGLPGRIAHLWSVTSGERAEPEEERFRQAQQVGYYSLLFLAQALGKASDTPTLRIDVVANGAYEVGGEESAPEKVTLLGPCKVIPQEHPNIACRYIDIDLPAAGTQQAAKLIGQLSAEIAAESSDVVVAYRGNRRWVQSFEPIRLPGDAAPLRSLRERGVYLITGGLGDVALLVAEYMARTARPRLVLVGRSAFPGRAEWDAWLADHDDADGVSRRIRRIQALEDLGAEVRVASADVADEAQMRALIAQVAERFGAINGVIHAAAVTTRPWLHTPIAEMGTRESEMQFRPKVYGLYVLERALEGQALDFCLLFSSTAAVLGGLGYVGYAAANLFMDAFAATRSRIHAVPWISATWDPWPEETKKYAGFQTSVDQYSMSLAESLEAFQRIVSQAPEGQVVIATGDLGQRIDRYLKRSFLREGPSAESAHTRANVRAPYLAPRDAAERTVAEVWEQILGIEQIGVHDNFFDLGGHSLLAMSVVSRLRDAFKVDLPLNRLFEVPTVGGLAAAIVSLRAEQEDAEELELLQMLAGLSEEQVEQEINRRIGVVE